MQASWVGVAEFVALVESGSFTAAAQHIGSSIAHISRQINALEDRLATKLFYRTTRRVSLTETGRIYYQHCRQLMDGLEEAEQAVHYLQATPRGLLKLTAPVHYGDINIVPLVSEFMLQYPELQVHCQLTNQRLDLVAEGFDLAIRLGRLEDSSLMARRLASRQLFVCAAPSYLAARGEPHLLSELPQHNCLRGTLEHWRFQEQGQERTVRIQGRFSCNSGQALLDAALKGLGIVQLPDYYVTEHLHAGQLVALLPAYQAADEGIWAVYPQNRLLSPKVRLLIDYLTEGLLG